MVAGQIDAVRAVQVALKGGVVTKGRRLAVSNRTAQLAWSNAMGQFFGKHNNIEGHELDTWQISRLTPEIWVEIRIHSRLPTSIGTYKSRQTPCPEHTLSGEASVPRPRRLSPVLMKLSDAPSRTP